MSGLFHFDSPLLKKLALIGNLAALNIIWLLCCIPIFTIGAATVAMHTVLLQYIEDTDDAVFRPFLKAFRENFKQATGIWLVFIPLLALLVFDAMYLYASTSLGFLWVPFALISLIAVIILTYIFPLLARYKTATKPALRNCLLLFLMDLGKSLLVVILNLIPWALMLFFPYFCARIGILWLCFCGSVFAFLGDCILLKIFKKRETKEEKEDQESLM